MRLDKNRASYECSETESAFSFHRQSGGPAEPPNIAALTSGMGGPP